MGFPATRNIPDRFGLQNAPARFSGQSSGVSASKQVGICVRKRGWTMSRVSETRKKMLRHRCSGAVEISPHIQRRLFVTSAMHMLIETAHKNGSSHEQVDCHGVMSMQQKTGGKGCLYSHTISPRLTLTRRRSVGRQGAPSPRASRRLVAMCCRRASSCSRQNLRRQAKGGRACMDYKMRTSNLATSR